MFLRTYIAAIETGLPIDIYYMLFDNGEWWACTKDGSDLVFEGEEYRKVCEVEYFGREGDRVLGLIKIENSRIMMYEYSFTFVRDELMPAYSLMRRIGYYYNFKHFKSIDQSLYSSKI